MRWQWSIMESDWGNHLLVSFHCTLHAGLFKCQSLISTRSLIVGVAIYVCIVAMFIYILHFFFKYHERYFSNWAWWCWIVIVPYLCKTLATQVVMVWCDSLCKQEDSSSNCTFWFKEWFLQFCCMHCWYFCCNDECYLKIWNYYACAWCHLEAA